MAKVLLIGGSGFLSGTVARQAVADGHDVHAVTRGQRPLPEGVTPITADRKDRNAFKEAVHAAGDHWDLVVDGIGFVPEDAQQDIETFRDRADHLVFVSTDFVFDPARRKFPQAEQSDHYLQDGYGGNKRQCELLFEASETGDLAWTVLRPGHIYGPGSQLGCLPEHGRDVELIARMQRGEKLRLVGGGHFLQQPIFAPDLAKLILSCHGNAKTHDQIFCCAGPDIIASRDYYAIIAEVLGVDVSIEETPVDAYLAANPEHATFLCHRFYDLSKLAATGAALPATSMRDGLRAHVESLM